MLDQYIMDQLKKNDENFHQLSDRLQKLRMEEESCNHIIDNLLNEEDVGIELFSPRNSEDSTRIKVGRIKKQIEDIQLEQAKVTEEMNKLKQEEDRYQEMLLELREKKEENLPDIGRPEKAAETMNYAAENSESTENQKEELKKILSRVDKCLNLLNTNRSQCKNEMINLKYYLKALISSK